MHILLYVLDALRADHLSCYGYKRETTPRIDALAREGVLFEHCFTSSTWTRPVAASILTGAYPDVHLTRSRYEMFSTPLTRLPEALKAKGFKTAAFSTMGNVGSEVGFARGFDSFHDLFRDPDILAKRRKLDAAREGLMHALHEKVALPRAEDINSRLLPWLAQNRTADTFSFIWSMETHVPYKAPSEFRRFSGATPRRPNEGERDDIRRAGKADRQRLMDLYDDEIYYNDHCIGQIIDHLKELDIYDDTLFVIVSDHGDAFYEHGFYTHGHIPYEELIHVPMIFKFPGQRYAGQRVKGLVELIDIFPTIMAVVGYDPGAIEGAFLQGYSLLPLIDGTRSQVREYVFSDTRSLEISNRYLSVRGQLWKYIQVQRPRSKKPFLVSALKHTVERRMLFVILRNPRHFLRRYLSASKEYLFELRSDPGEQCNLIAEHPDMADQLRRVLESWRQRNHELAQQVGFSPYTYEESKSLRRHLEELGYI